jgi:spore protease
MKPSEIFNYYNINVDLALEAHEIVRGETGQEIPGVRVDRERYNNSSVTTVEIVEKHAEQAMGKPVGSYITIEAPGIRANDKEIHQEVSELLAKKLGEILKLQEKSTVLLVGLGNWNATPDALGPHVIKYSLVTRHLHEYAPEELSDNLRPVCALSPGVLGITGIETAEIIKGVVDRIHPDLVIAIDALAAGSVERIASTIQLADTGINPGSALGNRRAGINLETMGVPVIAIGVPTVVHAAIIANSAINQLMEEFKTSPTLYQIYKNIRPEAIQGILDNVLQPFAGNLMVTPKEVDELITNISKIIASGITLALHPAISSQEVAQYLH